MSMRISFTTRCQWGSDVQTFTNCPHHEKEWTSQIDWDMSKENGVGRLVPVSVEFRVLRPVSQHGICQTHHAETVSSPTKSGVKRRLEGRVIYCTSFSEPSKTWTELMNFNMTAKKKLLLTWSCILLLAPLNTYLVLDLWYWQCKSRWRHNKL